MIDIGDFAVGLSRKLYGLTMHSERPQHRMYEQWHPLGVVGVITAFNFPVAVWAWNAFLAAVCGDAVVWKPSPKTPLTAIAVQHLSTACWRRRAAAACSRWSSSDARGAGRAGSPTTRACRWSRSPARAGSGAQVARRVAGALGPVAARMLGGNNAVIVDDDADLDLAMPAVLFGAVGTAGQRCTTTRRLIVHESRGRGLDAAADRTPTGRSASATRSTPAR